MDLIERAWLVDVSMRGTRDLFSLSIRVDQDRWDSLSVPPLRLEVLTNLPYSKEDANRKQTLLQLKCLSYADLLKLQEAIDKAVDDAQPEIFR